MTSITGRPQSASGAIPSLERVRAAVSMVFLVHSGLEKVISVGLGVTRFFGLSGFFATTHNTASDAFSVGAP